MAEQAQETEESLIEDISEQFQRASQLLTGDLDAAAEIAFEDIVDNPSVAARITAGLTDLRPLARPDAFGAAHRRVMRSLEILDRDGARDPYVPSLGPFKAV